MPDPIQPANRIVVRVMLALAFSLIAGAGARAAAPPSAEDFLRHLYAGYAIETGPNVPQPLGAQADSIFDAPLLGLIRRDQATTPQGEGGLMRVDPICDCQDWDGLRVQSIVVRPAGAGQADATVSFTNGGRDETLDYQLVTDDGQWRIHDIAGKTLPSLRHYLETGLAQRAAAAPVPPPMSAPSVTTYLYAVTVHDDGSVGLKYAWSYPAQEVTHEVCFQLSARPAPDTPPEWHFQQLGGWFDGYCHLVSAARFDTLQAFRTYIRRGSPDALVDDTHGLMLRIALPFRPPNSLRSIVVRLMMPGAQPITAGALRSPHDADLLTWTFTRQPAQSVVIQAAAESTTFKPTTVRVPTSPHNGP